MKCFTDKDPEKRIDNIDRAVKKMIKKDEPSNKGIVIEIFDDVIPNAPDNIENPTVDDINQNSFCKLYIPIPQYANKLNVNCNMSSEMI